MMLGMDYHQTKREVGKDTAKAILFFFVGIPLACIALGVLAVS